MERGAQCKLREAFSLFVILSEARNLVLRLLCRGVYPELDEGLLAMACPLCHCEPPFVAWQSHKFIESLKIEMILDNVYIIKISTGS